MTRSKNIIDDYANSSGQTRSRIESENGNQAGDPALAALAMIEVVNSPNPPQRLVLGADALENIRKKLDVVTQELNTWSKTTLNTTFLTSTGN